jgi:N utilization substance protein B
MFLFLFAHIAQKPLFFTSFELKEKAFFNFMLSRRNIRIKVMQLLYWMSRDQKVSRKELLDFYSDSVLQSYELFLYCLLVYMEVVKYSRADAKKRSSKHLPTEEDKKFTPKLCENDLFRSLSTNKELIGRFNDLNLKEKLNKDTIRKAYLKFSKSEAYRSYFLEEESSPSQHKQILLELLKSLSKNELFLEDLEDRYNSWVDDQSLVVGTLKRTVKGLPQAGSFFLEFIPSKETTRDFGETLLLNVIEKDKELLDLIEPVLRNWDADRVAAIDMILLKMALCEFLDFPTIPTKVTLNEYVELAKLYSTDKSKDFINGILDRLLKMLKKENRIQKKGRGLIE